MSVHKVKQLINELTPRLIELGRFLHQNPETCFQERQAAWKITEFMDSRGFEVEIGVADLETAFVCQKNGGKQGPTIAFIAEYDALKEVGHACGHNLIAMIAVAAACGLAPLLDDLGGTVKLIGTPGEEGGGGKVLMGWQGVFDGLDAALMAHPDCKTAMIKQTLSLKMVKVEFSGRAAHAAAAPFLGINALDAVIQTFNNVNALRQQLKSDVRIHGVITNGGNLPNIIPEYASAEFYLRSLELDDLDELTERFIGCIKGAEAATGAKAKISIDKVIYYPFKPNRRLAGTFAKYLSEEGFTITRTDPVSNIGSSDVGNLSQLVPTIHPTVAVTEEEWPIHSVNFCLAADKDLAYKRAISAAKALSLTGLKVLQSPETLREIKEEFQQS
ncbi:MAG: M20 family metallopeptidase [bacterium]